VVIFERKENDFWPAAFLARKGGNGTLGSMERNDSEVAYLGEEFTPARKKTRRDGRGQRGKDTGAFAPGEPDTRTVQREKGHRSELRPQGTPRPAKL